MPRSLFIFLREFQKTTTTKTKTNQKHKKQIEFESATVNEPSVFEIIEVSLYLINWYLLDLFFNHLQQNYVNLSERR